MTRLKAFVAAAVLACAAIAAAAPSAAQSTPSFNCKKARTFVEKAICGNATLARKDRRMASLYYERLNFLKRDGEYQRAADLQSTQRYWLSRRDRCQTVGCLHQAYDQRIAELDNAWD
ncbi:MAG: hypothetical protein K1X35_05460 [Caulobacteraceae bacterium]|nr:hypothetical protein [Caulobacteraceae bacterium]